MERKYFARQSSDLHHNFNEYYYLPSPSRPNHNQLKLNNILHIKKKTKEIKIIIQNSPKLFWLLKPSKQQSNGFFKKYSQCIQSCRGESVGNRGYKMLTPKSLLIIPRSTRRGVQWNDFIRTWRQLNGWHFFMQRNAMFYTYCCYLVNVYYPFLFTIIFCLVSVTPLCIFLRYMQYHTECMCIWLVRGTEYNGRLHGTTDLPHLFKGPSVI